MLTLIHSDQQPLVLAHHSFLLSFDVLMTDTSLYSSQPNLSFGVCSLCNQSSCNYICNCKVPSECLRCLTHLDAAMESVVSDAPVKEKPKAKGRKRKTPDLPDVAMPPAAVTPTGTASPAVSASIDSLESTSSAASTAAVTSPVSKKPRKPRGPNKPKTQPPPQVVAKKPRKPRGPNKKKPAKLDCAAPAKVGGKRKVLETIAGVVSGYRKRVKTEAPVAVQQPATTAALSPTPQHVFVMLHKWVAA